MENNYIIEKDDMYGKYVVWEVLGSLKVECFKGLKKECKEWIKNAI